MFFQDEACIGQMGTISRMWAPRGTRPRAMKQQQFGYVYIFGAVCPSTGESVAFISPEVGINAMNEHLNLISKMLKPGEIAVIVLDKASWHTSKKVSNFSNIVLMYLPPVSPELNPQEQVWQQLRNRYFSNRSFEGSFDLETSCCHAWNDYTQDKNRLKSLCSRSWANLDN